MVLCFGFCFVCKKRGEDEGKSASLLLGRREVQGGGGVRTPVLAEREEGGGEPCRQKGRRTTR